MTEPGAGRSLYVDDVFDEVLDLAPAERERVLAERCAGRGSLEAEVRALLLQVSGEPPREVELAAGQSLGRYRLEDGLGTGASASVWKAWDTHLQAYTALKVLHPHGARSGDGLEAVLQEARAASGIISDHVVRIKTAGRFAGGPHYIEMELCAEYEPSRSGAEELVVGQSLAELEGVGTAEAVRLVAEACRGVEAAHRAGVLHRDIKPANILITPVSRRALVTDFGLAASQLYPPPTDQTPATETVTVQLEDEGGVLVGTPSFMAPEQAYGHAPARASDVYALGATLFALLAGRPPYVPSEEGMLAAYDVIAQVREGPPVELRRVARVPRRLARIAARAMHRVPTRRYPTAAAMARDLDLYRQFRTTSVDGWRPLLQLALFARRNRELVTLGAALAAMLLVFAGAVGWLNLKRAQLEVEVGAAEVRRGVAEQLALIAERTRQGAEEERAQAEVQAAEALAARERALRSESDAEHRAAAASQARRDAEAAREAAEESKTAAEEARLAAEEARAAEIEARAQVEALLAAETEQRIATQSDLAVAERKLELAERSREGLEGQLREEIEARLNAETELSRALAALELAEARLVAPEVPAEPEPEPVEAP